MQLNIYINNKLYKTVTVEGDNYNPGQFYPEIYSLQQSGKLTDYNVEKAMKITVEKVSN